MSQKKRVVVVFSEDVTRATEGHEVSVRHAEDSGVRPVAGGRYEEVWAFVSEGYLADPNFVLQVGGAHSRGIPVRWFAISGADVHPLPHVPPDAFPKPAEVMHPRAAAARARSTFADVEARLKAGESYEDQLEAVDALLGTALGERDRELERDWADHVEEALKDAKGG